MQNREISLIRKKGRRGGGGEGEKETRVNSFGIDEKSIFYKNSRIGLVSFSFSVFFL